MQTLTPGEIARYCDVHQRTVSRWIATGKLKGFQLPGRGNYRVMVSDFIHFLQQQNMPVPRIFSADKSVLIVDDELNVRRSLSRFFKQHGYTVFSADNGFTAGSLLQAERPALMTLDLNMPGLNGFEVLAFIRQHPELQQTKIIVISGLGPEELERAKREGADAVLPKSFEHRELLELIGTLTTVKQELSP